MAATINKKRAAELQELHVKLIDRIEYLRKNSDAMRNEWIRFYNLLPKPLQKALTKRQHVSSVIASQVLTQPFFKRLFATNPIALQTDRLIHVLAENKAHHDFIDLFAYMKKKIDELDADAGKSGLSPINKLYQDFYHDLYPARKRTETSPANIEEQVYTPQVMVDFMLNSVNEVLQMEFGVSLSTPGVRIEDGFVGMGTFITRLLERQDLIKDSDLRYKYEYDIYCREIMPLSYFIAKQHIEAIYASRAGQHVDYNNIELGDTFATFEEHTGGTVYKQTTAGKKVIVKDYDKTPKQQKKLL